MGVLKALANLFPLVVTTVALAFVVTSFTSADWAHQSWYPIVDDNVTGDGIVQWNNASFSKLRSPFVVCTYNLSDPEVVANSGLPTSNLTQIDIICVRYPVSGAGKTSCETRTRYNTNFSVAETIRDDRMCEQVHFSGNLLVAAIVFVVIGFVIALPLTFYSMVREVISEDGDNDARGQVSGTPEASIMVPKQEQISQQNPGPQDNKKAISNQRKFGIPISAEGPGIVIGTLTFAMIVCLAIAAVATFLSQFYGILGLIQSNPENGQFAYSVTPAPSLTGSITYGPWVQGKALSIYLSLGWFFGAVGAGAAGGIWAGYLRRS